jgi:ketosteroid isomerase-like protein
MTDDQAQGFAKEWVAAWNERDLERVLSHYAEDIVFLSLLAQKVVGNGRVAGIGALRAYWGQALRAQPNIHFDLVDVYAGHDCLTILYRNHRGQQVTETLEFGPDGKVVRSFACYG